MHPILLTFLAATLGGGWLTHAATLDAQFEETPFVTVGSQVTGIVWAPDGSGRLLVTRKGGEIQIVKSGVLLPTPFATVSPVYTGRECGLIPRTTRPRSPSRPRGWLRRG